MNQDPAPASNRNSRQATPWRLLISGVFTLAGTGVSGLLLGIVFGGLTPTLSGCALLLGVVTGALAAWFTHTLSTPRRDPPGEWEIVALLAFTLVCLRLFFWVVYPRVDEWRVLLWNNLGDLSYHTTLIRFFANGAPFWPENPTLTNTPLGYPFGVDLLNSLLLQIGIDWIPGLIVVGLLGSALTGLALYLWGRGFTVAAFLFNGGLLPLMLWFGDDWQDPDQIAEWKNIPLTLFATQRGFLLAFPAGLLLLSLWRERHARNLFAEGPLPVRLPFAFECFLYATMPFFHLHTFLFLSFVLGCCALFGENRREAWKLIAGAFLPATALVWFLTDGFHSGRQLAWQPGWTQGDRPFFQFWLGNFGFFLPVLIALVLSWGIRTYRDPSRENKAALLLLATPALLLILTFFLRFAPWAWDNTKLMVWCYLMIAPVLWAVLKTLHELLATTMILILFGAGMVTLAIGLNPPDNGVLFAKRAEVDAMAPLLQSVPPQATIAAAPEYNHPLLLQGRPLVMGYEGHLASHGTDFEQTKTLLTQLMQGGPDWQEAAQALGVKYLFWGRWENARWPDSEKGWSDSRILGKNPHGVLYELRQPE